MIPQKTSHLKSLLESKKNFVEVTDYSMLESTLITSDSKLKDLRGYLAEMGEELISPFKKKKTLQSSQCIGGDKGKGDGEIVPIQ